MTPERMFPIVQNPPVPWSVAERAYRVYAEKYGTSQSLERLAERGGFHPKEMDSLNPGWRDQATELHRLREDLAAARAEIERLRPDAIKPASTVAVSGPSAEPFHQPDPTTAESAAIMSALFSDEREPDACTKHIPAFDADAARGLSADEVRQRWPRFEGECECGYSGIAYASMQHYAAGDW
jgi:hypothetical protein